MKEQFNRLTPVEHELLSILMEELSETNVIIGKILRHGLDNYHPNDPSTKNRDLLWNEIVDVMWCLSQIRSIGIIDSLENVDYDEINERKSKYLHHFVPN